MRQTSGVVQIKVEQPQAPPPWALLERELIRAQSEAIDAYYARYFDERGYLRCIPRWGGNDGPDDAAENFLNWPLLYALGAPERILDYYRHCWNGHLRQYTEAKTVEVPLARDGMYFKEFNVCFDWFHHGEWLNAFNLEGLADPHDATLIDRMRRYAGFYMGEDPIATNWDPEHRLIRSVMTGSRGPLLRQATALDWAGDPIEVEGRFTPLHRERTFEEMLEHYRDYNDVIGDNPLNLGATTLGVNAFALTGDEKYRQWAVDYINHWVEWTEENNGLVPSSIGLDGKVGSQYGWWGGVYGWGFTVNVVPLNGQKAHRNYQTRTAYGFANALLLTGDRGYLRPWRKMYDLVNANARQDGGQTLYPHMFGRSEGIASKEGEPGWYEFRPRKWSPSVEEMYYWTMDRSVLELLPEKPRWIAYLDGEAPEYPVVALGRDFERIRRRMEELRADNNSPDMTMSDDMNHINPAVTETLTQLMLGGLPTGRHGYPLHSLLRYFDPARRRPGIPEDVAALVERFTDTEVVVNLINLNPTLERTVIVQGGGYAEHQIEQVQAGPDAAPAPVSHSHFAVTLAPGAGQQLTLTIKRYANPPTLAFPWA